ncbi:MAG: 50S ribosomal protein L11 methyltransferase [Syntrophobacteraceae bacterium]
MTKNWTRIDVTCGPETAHILAVEFAETFGMSVEYISGGIRIYLESTRFAGEKERLRQIVDSNLTLPDEGEIELTVSEIPDEDWSRKWKEHFKPLQVGRRFLVTPTWEAVHCGPERLIIRIDPGRAFGTGHHESTRLCLEWLESCRELDQGSARRSLLDLGTGSGILAIGAALLGFSEVVGIDNDPEAVKVAEENIMLNGLSEKIRLLCATPEGVSGSFDVVISNIESKPLIRMSETIASKVRAEGLLALSGILIEQADEVVAEYEKRGLRPAGVKTAGEWVLLAFQK